ncbi:hypothetical protein [Marinoscillum sp. MHG1-6]|uniref:M61 family metallopeptidase n=1 Tax=Marinoscillum sp. MHG1-6 TaxID=2959627 RepID=UPI0021571020|nr:hypothetical protein [Marinoscillum sp. MHG1-6]
MFLIKHIRSSLVAFSFVLVLYSCSDDFEIEPIPGSIDLTSSIYYQVSIEDSRDAIDQFEVKVYFEGSELSSDIFQFPAAVPGTYRMANYGRYVTSIEVFDKKSKKIGVEQISANQWRIADKERAYYIQYRIAETWENDLEGGRIYPMGGTSINSEYALLNLFGVLGYPLGMEDWNYSVKLDYPSGWKVASDLAPNDSGLYMAPNYHEMVDSPMLLGNLSSVSMTVDNLKVGLYCYSNSGLNEASKIQSDILAVVEDALEFLEESPVLSYDFLFVFDFLHAGALEHSNSSVYVMMDNELTDGYRKSIRGIAAHEFFHTVTPLRVRSEMIDEFDYSGPTASKHLWLYEGVTEWASDMLLYRGGTLTIDELLDEIRLKYTNYKYGNPDVSLTEASAVSFTKEGLSYFASVYYKGSLAALLMDIQLLEWSDGTFGLRELIQELNARYAPGTPFSDDGLIEVLVDLSYPELQGFMDSYITGNQDLPVFEVLQKVGIESLNVVSNPDSAQTAMFNAWSQNL